MNECYESYEVVDEEKYENKKSKIVENLNKFNSIDALEHYCKLLMNEENED